MATAKKSENETIENIDEYEQMIPIRLPLTKDEMEDVFVRCNGQTWLIKRGVTVELPKCAVEILERAEDAKMEALAFVQAHAKD